MRICRERAVVKITMSTFLMCELIHQHPSRRPRDSKLGRVASRRRHRGDCHNGTRIVFEQTVGNRPNRFESRRQKPHEPRFVARQRCPENRRVPSARDSPACSRDARPTAQTEASDTTIDSAAYLRSKPCRPAYSDQQKFTIRINGSVNEVRKTFGFSYLLNFQFPKAVCDASVYQRRSPGSFDRVVLRP